MLFTFNFPGIYWWKWRCWGKLYCCGSTRWWECKWQFAYEHADCRLLPVFSKCKQQSTWPACKFVY